MFNQFDVAHYEVLKNPFSVTNTAFALGLPFSKDANDPTSPPTSMFFADTIVNEAGQRQSTFEAFLPRSVSLERQGNLFICPQVAVSKIDLQASQSGTQAVGVYFQREPVAGESSFAVQLYASARQEIILCAGAMASPQILMLRFVALEKSPNISLIHLSTILVVLVLLTIFVRTISL